MKALVLKEFGEPLLLEDAPVPQPGPDDALVRIMACAVDQFDLTMRFLLRRRLKCRRRR